MNKLFFDHRFIPERSCCIYVDNDRVKLIYSSRRDIHAQGISIQREEGTENGTEQTAWG
jgi:hypothetical protein